ncbi:MurR/RpiR family transcriptional regulator [Thomasclavelia cocleata]|uniref:MurR/RpiR family transcriptional regulator n=1 Tax=Thomasclavelia cocleata TaxID=69824 RepID=UPI002493EE72|nr:MurR/RpiR family transcriptional regulator [Thomasclavelia cocleata]
MKNLFYRLITFLDTANDADTNYNIAWYMAHNFSKIAKMGISQLAKECYVSTATISRFCRTLGYENYAHLKQACSSFTLDSRKFNNLINIPLNMMRNKPKECTKYYSNQVCKAISKLPNQLDWNVIDKVLQAIHDSDSVVFFGVQFSHSVALNFQTDLLMLEKFTMAYMETERQIDCAKSLDQNSVAIIVTVNGYFVHSNPKILQYLKKSRCKVVLMTSNPEIDIGINIDYMIVLGDGEQPKTGKHTLLTMIELISLRYYSLYYPNI